MHILKTTVKRCVRWPSNAPSDQVFENLGIVFVHIPKTGGTSIRKALSPYTPSTRRYPRLGKHAKAAVLRAATGNKLWNELTSIAVVRNPWDWTVSTYHWWVQLALTQPALASKALEIKQLDSFRSFVLSSHYKDYITHFRATDYIEWLIDSKGDLIVDHILRMECLNEDWQSLMAHFDLGSDPLPHENHSTHRDYRSYYDDDTAEVVAKKFKRSIDRFDYHFDTHPQ